MSSFNPWMLFNSAKSGNAIVRWQESMRMDEIKEQINMEDVNREKYVPHTSFQYYGVLNVVSYGNQG
jgi:hypothetical protein